MKEILIPFLTSLDQSGRCVSVVSGAIRKFIIEANN